MPRHSDIHSSPHSPAQLYAMVLDIERYPEFLPWCRAARIVERSDDSFVGELVVSFHGVTEKYSSRVRGIEGRAGDGSSSTTDEYCIDVTLVRGPFKHLSNRWRFVPRENGGSVVHFDVDFAFTSVILEKLIGKLFTKAVEKMSASFAVRADALYGSTVPQG